jgi:hypothetical protein
MAGSTVHPKQERHPGKGGRRGRARPKGRQTEEQALVEVRALLGEAPRERDQPMPNTSSYHRRAASMSRTRKAMWRTPQIGIEGFVVSAVIVNTSRG